MLPKSNNRTLEHVSHKRPIGSTSSSSSSSATTGVQHALSGQQQGRNSKRQRMGDYREPQRDDSDDEESCQIKENNISNKSQEDASDAAYKESQESALSGSSSASDESKRPVERTLSGQLRWILRKESKSPSISSVITEVSEVDVAVALGDDETVTPTPTLAGNSPRRHHAAEVPPIDTLVRNMETWSLTHIRALRRNNLYCEDRKQAVHAARRDVMRTLRQGLTTSSSTVSLASSGNYPHHNNESNDNGGSILTSESISLRRSSTTSSNSIRTI